MSEKNMKNKILKIAEKMFLEKPYDDIVMRDIAKALNISVGNLTYHFKKKDDLAEEVVLNVFSRHKQRPSCQSLEELDEWIASFKKSKDETSFYFKDFEQLAKISKKMRDIQQEVFARNLRFWRETLKNFNKAGILESEGFKAQYDTFIHNFYLLKARWNEQSVLESKLGIKKMEFRFRVWALLFPMLSSKGKRIFKNKIIL